MMKNYICFLPIILLFFSCSKENMSNETRDIRLKATVEASTAVSTKSVAASPYFDSSSGLKTSVWFSTVDGVYEDNPSPAAPTYIPYHAQVEYASDGMATVYKDPVGKQFPLTYPTDNTMVYCVGLYPPTGWELSGDNKSVSHEIDGITDLMYANQQNGSWQTPIPEQVYKHKLTLLKIIVRSTSFDAVDSWGKIKKITVTNPSDKINIDLSSSAVTYSGVEAPLVVMDTPMDLDIIAQEKGQVLCAPAKKYNIIVESEKSYVRDVDVILEDEAGTPVASDADAAGKIYIINLYFNSFNNIDAKCSLVPWNEENIELN